MKKVYTCFPQGLERILWLDVDGVRYFNINFTGDWGDYEIMNLQEVMSNRNN